MQYHLYATWAGLPAADIFLKLDDAAPAYRAEIDIRSVGVVKLLSKFGAHGTAEGTLADGKPLPAAYETDYKLRKKRNHQHLRYNADGNGYAAERQADDTSNKPPVEARLRRDTVDPLAALMLARDLLRRQAIGDAPAKLAIYDDKRRFDAEVRLAGRETLELPTGKTPAVHLHLLLTPVAGFRSASEEGEDIENKPREVELYLSDDAELAPLKMAVSAFYLPAIAQLVGRCNAQTPCAINPL